MHNHYPEIYTNWWIKKYGHEEYEKLVNESRIMKKWSIVELEEMIERFNNEISNYNIGGTFL